MAAGDSLRYHTRTVVPTGRPETYGSRTLTLHPEELAEDAESVPSREADDTSSQPIGTLKLRGRPSDNRKVKWDDGVVDNEGLGRKKSKICCIYHKPRAFDESSDEESSNSDSDNSDHNHDHKHEGGENSNHHHHHKRPNKNRSNSPNAYERQPQYKDRPHPGLESKDNTSSPS
ncbi:16057_t:CDS:2 [Funneliformis geosporum]|uniref:Type 1 phosphatases regulator n=1 Tax=Funneliformis geosporum TaxID=1117311 RepID=A0A9W4WVI6_9GLOM|nr:16057_t:CDS:2 [Funneliformis geosporum]CAI2166766.1 4450_t:CDS:2 [Funneliformis geosporum]